MALTHIKSNDNRYTVNLGGQPFIFDPAHPSYVGLVECVHSEDADEFVNLFNTGHQIEDWSEGDFEFRDGFLYFEDEQIATDPTNRIVECIAGGFPHRFMLNYLTNLYDNVSERAVQESYKWTSHKGLPITEDGMMVGYKGVRSHVGETINVKNGELKDGDLVDIYTGKTFRNNIVSVPSDCEHSKLRVSEYEVIAVAREQLEEPVYMEDEDDDYDYESVDAYYDDEADF
jgi:hypothetical protein